MSSAINAEGGPTAAFDIPDYDVDATLGCGQAFRWEPVHGAWEGVVSGRWVRVESEPAGIRASCLGDPDGWGWLRRHLALDEDLSAILGTFPSDPPMRAAVDACRGLRLLRQEPWECLASFICSSTKQIVQIRQIVRELAGAFGEPVVAPADRGPLHAFPGPAALASAGEAALRACRLGFRAPYLLDAAERVVDGRLDLEAVGRMPTVEAREALMSVDGVGPKVADCVLLFAYGRQDAFPIDVWVRRALAELYFPKARRLTPERLARFSAGHFGPYGGYAQQYLFHHIRLRAGRVGPTPAARVTQTVGSVGGR
jgi:N-glycosylase/DNA lyase